MNQRPSESHWPLTILLGLSSLFNLFLPLILVRLLTAEQVGVYKLFFLYSVTGPWILFASGFSKGIYFWGGHWRNNPTSRLHAFSATWSYQIAWSLIVLSLGIIAYPFLKYIPEFLFSDPIYVGLLITTMAVVVPSSFYEECRIVRGENKYAGFYGAFWDILRTIALLYSAFHFKSIAAVIIANLLIVTLKLFVSSYLVLKNNFATFSLVNNPERKAVWKYALPSSGAAFLAVLYGYGDQFVLGHYLEPAEFALYSLGCLSIPPLLIFEQSINKVMLPHLTKAMSENLSSAWKTVRIAIMDLGLWLIPSAVGLFFYAGPITRLLFTNKYPETEHFLRLYSCFYLFFIIPFDAWERALGKTTWILKTTTVFAFLSLVSTWVGAKYFNAYVALSVFLFWQMSLRIYSLFVMRHRLNWKIRHIVPVFFLLRSFVVSIFLGFTTNYLVESETRIFKNETVALFSWGIVFWVLYIIICVPWALKKERKERASKKVLILTQYLNIGGLERMIYNLSHGLQKYSDWEPSVYVYDAIPGVSTMDSAFSHLKLHRNNKKNGFSLKLGYQISRLTKTEGIDQIHAHDLGALIYAVLAKFFSFGRLRVIYTLHSVVHFKKNKYYPLYEKIFSYFSDEIIVVSEQLKTQLVKIGVNENKISVVENGVLFADRLKSNSDKLQLKSKLLPGFENLNWIISLARLHPGKGQVESIKIWNSLSNESRQKCALIFVGGETEVGYTKIIKDEISKAKNPENIILAGSTLEPAPWLQASDMFISASQQEGLPLAPLEALALNIPVVISDIPGHEMFKGAAQFFSLNNLPKASLAVETALNAKSTLSSPEALLHRFSLEQMTAQYIQAYNEEG